MSDQQQLPVYEVGPELDALIAEKVMGTKWRHCYGGKGLIRFLSDDDRYEEADGSEEPAVSQLPRYSKELPAAWRVVTMLLRRGCIALSVECFVTDDGPEWEATFDEHSASAPTAPLAICRAAALLVGGVKPPQ
jgi:hypothetical protein